ncbi:Eukaryotic translation initiation factor 3 subunit J [Vitis vinifera]|uniref:Eukaryotic translation initiation factor 3 subunit J n=1 Tax=Vitis vinifera TaxID=29760 RepID=A0A438F1H1_VITVI|nr:Eukaryotic translation initiation factor 3 subunit J [Vitis vinifera]
MVLLEELLIEEADYKSTTELFAKRGDEKTLDNFIPKSESDFVEYAELISHKLRSYEKSFHYIGLLKAVIRLSMTSLKAADAKEIASSVTAIANEKLKAEKEANTGAKKKQLHVDKPDDDVVVNAYDDIDDYDFINKEQRDSSIQSSVESEMILTMRVGEVEIHFTLLQLCFNEIGIKALE